MRDDLIGGIKNALERGATIEQAIQSLINAGYNINEVKEAASYAHEGVLASMSQPASLPVNQRIVQQNKQPIINPVINKPLQPTQFKSTAQIFPIPRPLINPLPSIKNNQSSQKQENGTIILLSAILFVLIVGLVLTIIFRDKIIGWFG